MPVSGKLEEIAADHGLTVEALMTAMLEQYSTPYRIATELRVYPNTVRWWLANNGYVHTDGKWRKQAASRD